MNIDEMTIKQIKEVAAIAKGFGDCDAAPSLDNGMIGKYVVVRCRDAGVHTGYLESHNGRECVLTNSRRLWYWKPANKQKFLSGVATDGLHDNSKVGKPVDRIHLTENCEIIQCSGDAEKSITGAPINEC